MESALKSGLAIDVGALGYLRKGAELPTRRLKN